MKKYGLKPTHNEYERNTRTMNLLYKAFCRTYQLCFYMALPLLPYREPTKLKSTDDIAKILKMFLK